MTSTRRGRPAAGASGPVAQPSGRPRRAAPPHVAAPATRYNGISHGKPPARSLASGRGARLSHPPSRTARRRRVLAASAHGEAVASRLPRPDAAPEPEAMHSPDHSWCCQKLTITITITIRTRGHRGNHRDHYFHYVISRGQRTSSTHVLPIAFTICDKQNIVRSSPTIQPVSSLQRHHAFCRRRCRATADRVQRNR